MNTIKNTDVVFISNIEWSLQWQRHQIFATFFSHMCRQCIFVESHGKRNPELKDLPRILGRVFRFISRRGKKPLKKADKNLPENLVVISPLVLPSTHRIFRTINGIVFIPSLVRSIKKLGVQKPIIMNYLPTQTSIELIQRLDPCLVVYDCVENFPEYPGVPGDIAKIEEHMFESADLVFTDSNFLYEKASQFRKETKRIMPGVDYGHFAKADTGRPDYPVKSLCFFGGINDRRIDFALLREISKLDHLTVDMIGPVDSKVPPLPSNVVFHGPVDYSELPEHIKSCDCFLFPYRVTEFTKGIIPAKLFECFATGKPVITTPLPSFFEYAELMYICQTAEEAIDIIQNLERHETELKSMRRKELAKKSSWDSRFEELVDQIKRKLEKGS